jgi:hypothetical protein
MLPLYIQACLKSSHVRPPLPCWDTVCAFQARFDCVTVCRWLAHCAFVWLKVVSSRFQSTARVDRKGIIPCFLLHFGSFVTVCLHWRDTNACFLRYELRRCSSQAWDKSRSIRYEDGNMHNWCTHNDWWCFDRCMIDIGLSSILHGTDNKEENPVEWFHDYETSLDLCQLCAVLHCLAGSTTSLSAKRCELTWRDWV